MRFDFSHLVARSSGRGSYSVIAHVSSYSKCGSHIAVPGNNLNKFHSPQLPADLNAGFSPTEENSQEKNSIPSPAESLCPVLLSTRFSSLTSISVHFITFRNNLNKIMNLPYNLRAEWRIGVERLNDPYFGRSLCLHVMKDEPSPSNERHQRMCYWGRKFEQVCTVDHSVQEEAGSEFCSVLVSQLNSFRLLVGAEIDCHEAPDASKPTPRHFVELKTNAVLNNERQKWSFYQNKLRSTWIQSMIAGVPTVKFGWRDDDGHLQKLTSFPTTTLPETAKATGAHWHPPSCIDFTSAVLGFLYEQIREPGERYILSHSKDALYLSLEKTEETFPDILFAHPSTKDETGTRRFDLSKTACKPTAPAEPQ